MFAENCKKSNTLHRWALRILPVFAVIVGLVLSLAAPASATYQDNAYVPYNGFYAVPTGDITYLSDLGYTSSYNYNGTATVLDGTYKNGSPIWLGGTSSVGSPVTDGELFYKGLGVMPDRADNGNFGTSWTTFDVSNLNADTFYAVVGITNVNGQNYAYGDDYNGSTFEGGGVVFQVCGSYDSPNSFVVLAESEPITKTQTGEFLVDITGVKYLRLVVKCNLDVYGGHVSMNSAWGNACVYNSEDGGMSNSVGILDYNDFVTDIQVDGNNDLVTITIPSSMAYWILSGADGIESSSGKYASYGNGITANHSVTFMPLGRNAFVLDDFPSGAKLTTSVHVTTAGDLSDSDFTVWDSFPAVYYYSDNLSLIDESAVLDTDEVWDYDNRTISKTFSFTLNDSSVASYFSMAARWFDLQFDTDAAVYSCDDTVITFSISSAYAEAQQSNKTNKLLEAVEDKLEEQGKTMEDVLDQQQQTNEKLDDIISGGEAGEDLMAGSDKLEDAGEGLGDDIGQIQDFENQYFGQLEDSMGDIVGAGDLSFLVAPLSFCQGYLNKIVAGIPSKYMVIFTLPVLFGIFFYVVQHPIKAPRPDTSGDQVTRETFTTTTVLSGKHAGQSTTTRTVTTSQEIGRVHRE